MASEWGIVNPECSMVKGHIAWKKKIKRNQLKTKKNPKPKI